MRIPRSIDHHVEVILPLFLTATMFVTERFGSCDVMFPSFYLVYKLVHIDDPDAFVLPFWIVGRRLAFFFGLGDSQRISIFGSWLSSL